MKAPKKASTALRRAARIIRERGWHRGTLRSQTGAVCALGALRIACRNDVFSVCTFDRVYEGAAQSFGRAVGLDPIGYDSEIASWNDCDERTKPQVIRAFERAAKLAEKQERAK